MDKNNILFKIKDENDYCMGYEWITDRRWHHQLGSKEGNTSFGEGTHPFPGNRYAWTGYKTVDGHKVFDDDLISILDTDGQKQDPLRVCMVAGKWMAQSEFDANIHELHPFGGTKGSKGCVRFFDPERPYLGDGIKL